MSAEVVGRDAELRTVAAFLDELAAGPAVLVVAGEAGAGKTTLLRAAAEMAAEQGISVLRATPSHSDVPLAFGGLADLLHGQLPDIVAQLRPPLARALRMALLAEEAPAGAEVLQPPEPRLIAAAFRAAVLALAQSGPVLLIVDDVQWLDAESAAAVGFAARRLETEHVGLLCAHRAAPDQGAELPLELSRARLRPTELPVPGLSLGALHRILRAGLRTSFARPTLRRIAAGSGGNPFIALEIGRALLRRYAAAAVTTELPGWQPVPLQERLPGPETPPPDTLPIPETLAGLVSERLGALTPEVLGATQFVALLPNAPAAQYVTAGAAGDALDAAVLAGVLEERSGRLTFVHPLLAAAVADRIPPVRRRELHAAVARVARLPEERARHQALAADQPAEPVAAELTAAATVAARRGAPAAAAELFELAAALTPAEQADARLQRQLDAARQHAVAGETKKAMATLADFVATAPPGLIRSDALAEYGRLRQDDLASAGRLLEQALAEAADDAGRRTRIRDALSHHWLMRGDAGRALDQARLALDDAEASGSAALIAVAAARTFDLGLMRGDAPDEELLDRALKFERAALDRTGGSDAAGDSLRYTSPSMLAGMWHLHAGKLDTAEAELTYVLTRAEVSGVEYLRAETMLRLAQVALKRGDAAKATDLAADSLDVSEQLELSHLTCAALHGGASAALLLGETDQVRAIAVRGARYAAQVGDQPFVVMHEALLGSLDLALGNHPAAASRLGDVLRDMHLLGVRPAAQAIWADSVEALAAVGELAEAERICGALARSAREPATAAIAARCRGVVAAARGDTSAALTELAAAVALHDQVEPIPLERGRTLLWLGRVQRRVKRRAAARATLTEAAVVLGGIGARLWAAQAEAELARISGRQPDRAGLTETEQRVAELVALGLSNREVAAALYVTVRAVESTLTKTYGKLGVRSRTELASRMRPDS
jgi:DNA-binding CsgD family transcriptional regulator